MAYLYVLELNVAVYYSSVLNINLELEILYLYCISAKLLIQFLLKSLSSIRKKTTS